MVADMVLANLVRGDRRMMDVARMEWVQRTGGQREKCAVVGLSRPEYRRFTDIIRSSVACWIEIATQENGRALELLQQQSRPARYRA